MTFFPFAQIGSTVLPASRLFPQAFSNKIIVWALLNAVLIVLRNLHAALGVQAHTAFAQYLVNVVALAGGFVLLLLIQYGALFTTGHVPTFFMNDALRTIVAINFVPLMSIVAFVTTFTFRRTGTYVPGALICAALVAWYVVVGQATQAAP